MKEFSVKTSLEKPSGSWFDSVPYDYSLLLNVIDSKGKQKSSNVIFTRASAVRKAGTGAESSVDHISKSDFWIHVPVHDSNDRVELQMIQKRGTIFVDRIEMFRISIWYLFSQDVLSRCSLINSNRLECPLSLQNLNFDLGTVRASGKYLVSLSAPELIKKEDPGKDLLNPFKFNQNYQAAREEYLKTKGQLGKVPFLHYNILSSSKATKSFCNKSEKRLKLNQLKDELIEYAKVSFLSASSGTGILQLTHPKRKKLTLSGFRLVEKESKRETLFFKGKWDGYSVEWSSQQQEVSPDLSSYWGSYKDEIRIYDDECYGNWSSRPQFYSLDDGY